MVERKARRAVNKKKTVRTAVLAMFCLLFWVPVLVMFPSSFMGPEELKAAYGGGAGRRRAGGSDGTAACLSHVKTLCGIAAGFSGFLRDVLEFGQTGVPILLGQVLVGMPAAWAFGRYRFTGRRILFLLYMILMIMPSRSLWYPVIWCFPIYRSWIPTWRSFCPGFSRRFRCSSCRSFFIPYRMPCGGSHGGRSRAA